MEQQIEIPLNKKRILPNLAGALVFTILGIGMMAGAIIAKGQLLMQVFIFIVGLASLLFFGLIAVVLLIKIFKNKAGMIISEEGLTDNASGVSPGFIAWQDIRKINYTYNGNYTFLVIVVKNPAKYIKRETNFLKRLAMRMNHKIAGSPIHILVSFLDTNLSALNNIIADKRYQKKNGGG